MSEEFVVYENDDEGYVAWVRGHNGHVLTERAGGEFMLHDCDCSGHGRASVDRESAPVRDAYEAADRVGPPAHRR
jgi:hypothetical protein